MAMKRIGLFPDPRNPYLGPISESGNCRPGLEKMRQNCVCIRPGLCFRI